MVVRTRRAA